MHAKDNALCLINSAHGIIGPVGPFADLGREGILMHEIGHRLSKSVKCISHDFLGRATPTHRHIPLLSHKYVGDSYRIPDKVPHSFNAMMLPGVAVRSYFLGIEARFLAAQRVPAHEVWKYLASDI